MERSDDLEAMDPVKRFGSAKHPERPLAKTRPPGMDDATVSALGKLSEALEVVEHARGLLYAFHRHCGIADLTLQEAVSQLREAGYGAIADELDEVLVGRDIIEGRWSFQVIEDYDQNYYGVFRDMEARARRLAGDVPDHLYEAEMKYDEQAAQVGSDTADTA
jgi:hypothetical protein